jgi:uncharacterized protein (TIGR01244 family)
MKLAAASTALLALLSLACSPSSEPTPPTQAAAKKLEPYSCGTVQRLHTFDGIFLASQPSEADFREANSNGIRTVVNLRMPDELKDFDEPALIKSLNMQYVALPFSSPESLTPEIFDAARALLRDSAQRPLLLHCNSSNRVGAIWLAHRVLDGKLDYASALAEAHTVGLKTPALEERTREYLRSQGVTLPSAKQ